MPDCGKRGGTQRSGHQNDDQRPLQGSLLEQNHQRQGVRLAPRRRGRHRQKGPSDPPHGRIQAEQRGKRGPPAYEAVDLIEQGRTDHGRHAIERQERATQRTAALRVKTRNQGDAGGGRQTRADAQRQQAVTQHERHGRGRQKADAPAHGETGQRPRQQRLRRQAMKRAPRQNDGGKQTQRGEREREIKRGLRPATLDVDGRGNRSPGIDQPENELKRHQQDKGSPSAHRSSSKGSIRACRQEWPDRCIVGTANP